MLVTSPRTLGLRYRRLRKEKGLTQTDVARMAGTTQKTVSGFESGKINLQVDTVFRLMSVIGAAFDVKSSKDLAKENEALEW